MEAEMWKQIGLAMFVAMGVSAAARVSAQDLSTQDLSMQDPTDREWQRGLSALQFCGGELPGWGRDACGAPEHQHGYGSCWRRLAYRPGDKAPRLQWICGRSFDRP